MNELQARVQELEADIEEMRGIIRTHVDQKYAALKQVKVLQEALEWPERLGMFCMYCGKTSSAMHCQECFQRMAEMPILAAHEFNAQAALSASSIPVGEEHDPGCTCEACLERFPWRRARGVVKPLPGSDPPEVIIRRMRDGDPHQPETQTVCQTCEGSGDNPTAMHDFGGQKRRQSCPSCGGSGVLTPEETDNV